MTVSGASVRTKPDKWSVFEFTLSRFTPGVGTVLSWTVNTFVHRKQAAVWDPARLNVADDGAETFKLAAVTSY